MWLGYREGWSGGFSVLFSITGSCLPYFRGMPGPDERAVCAAQSEAAGKLHFNSVNKKTLNKL